MARKQSPYQAGHWHPSNLDGSSTVQPCAMDTLDDQHSTRWAIRTEADQHIECLAIDFPRSSRPKPKRLERTTSAIFDPHKRDVLWKRIDLASNDSDVVAPTEMDRGLPDNPLDTTARMAT